MLQAGRSRVRVPMRWNFLSFQPHCGPGVDSASNRNEYQEPGTIEYIIIIIISVRGRVDPTAGRVRSIEKSRELIGKRTRYFQACSIVPQLRATCRYVATQVIQFYLGKHK
jgi:hypothetical protein